MVAPPPDTYPPAVHPPPTPSTPSSQILRGLRATARWSGLGHSLSPRRLQAVALRFGRVALGLVGLKVVIMILAALTGSFRQHDAGWFDLLSQVAYMIGGLGLYWIAQGERLAPRHVITLGYGWSVLAGLQSSLYVNGGPWPEVLLPGVSPAGLWTLLIALLIPGPPLKATLAALLTLATDPLSVAVHVQLGMDCPPTDLLVMRFFPNLAVLLIVLFVSRHLHSVERALSAADAVGSYRLVEKLGEGGMGEVWRAQHRFLARPAAVKLIRADALGLRADTVAQRFEREAQVTATLQSPHTVAVYDFGRTDDDRLFYVMELLDGLDLDTLVKRHGPLPPARAVALLRQACRSLAEAHAHGLVHRDVKPANLFVCRHGGELDVLKVLDFGLVRHGAGADGESRLTRDGQLTGTPAFAAPEQMLGEAITPATDLYALGGVAWWLLTGRLVFEAPTAMAQVARHLRDTPAAPSTAAPGPLPPALDALICQCLAKAPGDRPASAEALGHALEALLSDPATLAPWPAQARAEWWAAHGPSPRGTPIEIGASGG